MWEQSPSKRYDRKVLLCSYGLMIAARVHARMVGNGKKMVMQEWWVESHIMRQFAPVENFNPGTWRQNLVKKSLLPPQQINQNLGASTIHHNHTYPIPVCTYSISASRPFLATHSEDYFLFFVKRWEIAAWANEFFFIMVDDPKIHYYYLFNANPTTAF